MTTNKIDGTPPAPPLAVPMSTEIAMLANEYAEIRKIEQQCKARRDELASQLKVAAENLHAVHADAGYGDDTVWEGMHHTVRVSKVVSWGLDSRRLKAEDPETWARFAKQRTSVRLDVKEG